MGRRRHGSPNSPSPTSFRGRSSTGVGLGRSESSPGRRRRHSPASRSRSRSRSPRAGRRSKFPRHRSKSTSPSALWDKTSRRPGFPSYESPPENECLGVFNLNPVTRQRDLEDIFSDYGRIRDINIITDRYSGRSRGFGFVYFYQVNDARWARDRCNGLMVAGRRIRVDFSATRGPHQPTPGQYMGRPTPGYDDYGRDQRPGRR